MSHLMRMIWNMCTILQTANNVLWFLRYIKPGRSYHLPAYVKEQHATQADQ